MQWQLYFSRTTRFRKSEITLVYGGFWLCKSSKDFKKERDLSQIFKLIKKSLIKDTIKMKLNTYNHKNQYLIQTPKLTEVPKE